MIQQPVFTGVVVVFGGKYFVTGKSDSDFSQNTFFAIDT